jgi:hypothetical protein
MGQNCSTSHTTRIMTASQTAQAPRHQRESRTRPQPHHLEDFTGHSRHGSAKLAPMKERGGKGHWKRR